MRIRQGAVVGVVACVMALVMGGCTGEATNVATPSASLASNNPSTSPQASEPVPTSTPTLPASSPAMAQPTAEGALAAAQYYMGLYDFSMATGDLTEWRAMSAADCKFCNKVIARVEELVALGQTVSSARVTFASAVGNEVVPHELYGANMIVSQGVWTKVDRSGEVVDTGPPSSVRMDFAIAWEADSWLVRQVDVHEATPEP
jgi:hypothetical protein